jgi:alpha-ketoglutaric semialdehyde dehydrogenase
MNSILVGGQWRPASQVGEFEAFNPRTSEPLGEKYPISSWDDCSAALDFAQAAAEELELLPDEQIAAFLDRYAERLSDAAAAICAQAETETALPLKPRLLDVEMPRTINQLRLAAKSVREGAWRLPVVDAEAGIRSCYGSLGPAFICGPNNFPFAFNAVSGGDFAAAIAAGNPVIAKAHSAHPGTSRLLAEQAHLAVTDAGLPAATVQMLFGIAREDGLRMVSDSRLSVAAFTGGRDGGLALKQAADAVGTPIYLEMSSVNPIFFLPGAVAERGDDLPGELVGSCLLGVGQFCTSPNMFVLTRGEATDQFLEAARAQMDSAPVGALLGKGGLESLQKSVATLQEAGADVLAGARVDEQPGYRFQNTLLQTTGEQFLKTPEALQTEAFGPATLAVVVDNTEEALAVAAKIEGSLTGSIYSAADGSDDALAEQLMRVLRRKVGRLLNDKMPTGVAVSPAMNHGGPFPATGHPGFTAVGLPASIRRFAKLDCYDNVREARLPECLRD